MKLDLVFLLLHVVGAFCWFITLTGVAYVIIHFVVKYW